jgi:hypothetical protein
MKVIRVVVGHVPRILREILEGALTLHPDIEFLHTEDEHLSRAAAAFGADAAIVAETAVRSSGMHRAVLADHPDLKMFVVTDGGHAAHLLELRRTPIVEVSPTGLVNAIKAAVLGQRASRTKETGR